MLIEKGLAMKPHDQTLVVNNGKDEDIFSSNSNQSVNHDFMLSNGMPDIAWPKPILRDTTKEFVATITNIDDLGQIYVQYEDNIEKANAIASILTEIHCKIVQENEDQNWSVGDPVIAKYEDLEENLLSWNRGLVTKIYSDGNIQVLYVDYGQTARLDPSKNECHKCLMFTGMYKRVQKFNHATFYFDSSSAIRFFFEKSYYPQLWGRS